MSDNNLQEKENIPRGCLKLNNKIYPVFEGLNTVGRNPDAVINIKHLGISKQHAVITVIDQNAHYISDFKSSNGTILDSKKLFPLKLYQLNNGASIKFGNVFCTYKKMGPGEKLDGLDYTTQSFTESFYGASTQEVNLPNAPKGIEFNELPTQVFTSKELSFHEMPTQVFEPKELSETSIQVENLGVQDESSNDSIDYGTMQKAAESQMINKKDLQLTSTPISQIKPLKLNKKSLIESDNEDEAPASQICPVKTGKKNAIESDSDTEEHIGESDDDTDQYAFAQNHRSKYLISDDSETDIEEGTEKETQKSESQAISLRSTDVMDSLKLVESEALLEKKETHLAHHDHLYCAPQASTSRDENESQAKEEKKNEVSSDLDKDLPSVENENLAEVLDFFDQPTQKVDFRRDKDNVDDLRSENEVVKNQLKEKSSSQRSVDGNIPFDPKENELDEATQEIDLHSVENRKPSQKEENVEIEKEELKGEVSFGEKKEESDSDGETQEIDPHSVKTTRGSQKKENAELDSKLRNYLEDGEKANRREANLHSEENRKLSQKENNAKLKPESQSAVGKNTEVLFDQSTQPLDIHFVKDRNVSENENLREMAVERKKVDFGLEKDSEATSSQQDNAADLYSENEAVKDQSKEKFNIRRSADGNIALDPKENELDEATQEIDLHSAENRNFSQKEDAEIGKDKLKKDVSFGETREKTKADAMESGDEETQDIYLQPTQQLAKDEVSFKNTEDIFIAPTQTLELIEDQDKKQSLSSFKDKLKSKDFDDIYLPPTQALEILHEDEGKSSFIEDLPLPLNNSTDEGVHSLLSILEDDMNKSLSSSKDDSDFLPPTQALEYLHRDDNSKTVETKPLSSLPDKIFATPISSPSKDRDDLFLLSTQTLEQTLSDDKDKKTSPSRKKTLQREKDDQGFVLPPTQALELLHEDKSHFNEVHDEMAEIFASQSMMGTQQLVSVLETTVNEDVIDDSMYEESGKRSTSSFNFKFPKPISAETIEKILEEGLDEESKESKVEYSQEDLLIKDKTKGDEVKTYSTRKKKVFENNLEEKVNETEESKQKECMGKNDEQKEPPKKGRRGKQAFDAQEGTSKDETEENKETKNVLEDKKVEQRKSRRKQNLAPEDNVENDQQLGKTNESKEESSNKTENKNETKVKVDQRKSRRKQNLTFEDHEENDQELGKKTESKKESSNKSENTNETIVKVDQRKSRRKQNLTPEDHDENDQELGKKNKSKKESSNKSENTNETIGEVDQRKSRRKQNLTPADHDENDQEPENKNESKEDLLNKIEDKNETKDKVDRRKNRRKQSSASSEEGITELANEDEKKSQDLIGTKRSRRNLSTSVSDEKKIENKKSQENNPDERVEKGRRSRRKQALVPSDENNEETNQETDRRSKRNEISEENDGSNKVSAMNNDEEKGETIRRGGRRKQTLISYDKKKQENIKNQVETVGNEEEQVANTEDKSKENGEEVKELCRGRRKLNLVYSDQNYFTLETDKEEKESNKKTLNSVNKKDLQSGDTKSESSQCSSDERRSKRIIKRKNGGGKSDETPLKIKKKIPDEDSTSSKKTMSDSEDDFSTLATPTRKRALAASDSEESISSKLSKSDDSENMKPPKVRKSSRKVVQDEVISISSSSSINEETVKPGKRRLSANSRLLKKEEETKQSKTTTKRTILVTEPPMTPERNKRTLKPKVVFTMMESPEFESLIRQLGGSVVDSVDTCTVLVTESIKRSQKLLCAVAQGKPICGPQWLQACKKAFKFLDPWDFILEDPEAEQKWNFSLRESLRRAKEAKLLESYTFQLIVNNAADVLKGAIEACGGKCVRSLAKASGNLVIVSAENNKSRFTKIVKQNPEIMVVEAEAIFDGTLRQEFKFREHLIA